MILEDLPVSLDIKKTKLIGYLTTIREQVTNYWSRQIMHHYTNHGVDHSDRIIQIIGNLLRNREDLLNEHERFILLTSIYLHDIGMQGFTFSDLKKKTNYTFKEMTKIRNSHHKITKEMILDSIKPNAKLKFGLEYCQVYIPSIIIVCLNHRKSDLKLLEDTSIGNEDIKVPLLNSLLIIGDELDSDYRRINMEHLKIIDIPVESKLYWWSHHFVQSIQIKNEKIKIYFRFPIKRKKQSEITNIFLQKIKAKIKNTLDEIYDILDEYRIRLYPEIICEINYVADGVLEPLPIDLMKFMLNESIIKKEIFRILPKEMAEMVFNDYLSSRLFNPEFNIDIKVGDKLVDVQLKIESNKRKFFFRILSERPSRKTLDIISEAKKKYKKNELFIPIKKGYDSNYHIDDEEILCDDSKSVEKLREMLRSGC